MYEHAALMIEHAKVKKMLLADKDHELREYEYQWGVARRTSRPKGLMVVEGEVAVLRGLVLQMHKHLADATRVVSRRTSRGACRELQAAGRVGTAPVSWGQLFRHAPAGSCVAAAMA